VLVTILATVRLLRTLGRAFLDPATRGLVVLAGLTLLFGTFFYARVEGWRLLDSLYFAVVTLTTIGYGDLTPATDAGKLFTIAYTLLGIGVIAAFVTAIATRARREEEAARPAREARRRRRRTRGPEPRPPADG
jgi:voltage-gated potassium channel